MSTATEPEPGAPAAHFGNAQRAINVIDARQAYPQRVVQRALHRRITIARPTTRSISYEVVALTPAAAAELGLEIEEGHGSVALSGRRGIEVRADDLLDRAIARLSANARDAESAQMVAAGAVRYYLLKFSLTQIIAFDFDEATRHRRHGRLSAVRTHARARRRYPPQGRCRRRAGECPKRCIPPSASCCTQSRGIRDLTGNRFARCMSESSDERGQARLSDSSIPRFARHPTRRRDVAQRHRAFPGSRGYKLQA